MPHFTATGKLKPGTCPAPPEDGNVGCSLEDQPECEQDNDCDGEQKCCMWNCGKACVQPKVGGNSHFNSS